MTGGNFSVRVVDVAANSIDDVIEIDDSIDDIIDVDAITPAKLPKTEKRPRVILEGGLEEDELSQPFVDIHDLFNKFNYDHFDGKITATFVEYSSRMTLCAGTCTFKGAAGGCRIALSEPLLKFRPRSDLISTLLHEMIHAFLFITEGVAVRDGVDGHGPKFLAHADRINRVMGAKANITPYHTFTDEVDVHRVHHWTCNRCSKVIKRAMNRAPAPRDPFWPSHQKACVGSFIKTKEPPKKKKMLKRAPKRRAVAVDASTKNDVQLPKGVMRTRRIDSMLAGESSNSKREMVSCPVCNTPVAKLELNDHLDQCLSPALFSDEATKEICIPDSDDEKGHSQANGRMQLQSNIPDTLSFESKDLADGGRSRSHDPWESASRLKQSRNQYDALKRMIPDTDLLMSFSMNPLHVNRQDVLGAFHVPARKFNEASQPGSAVASLLKQVTRDESPCEQQRLGAERLLRQVGNGLLVEETMINKLAEQYGVNVETILEKTLVKKNLRKDNGYVIPESIFKQAQSKQSEPASPEALHVPARTSRSPERSNRPNPAGGSATRGARHESHLDSVGSLKETDETINTRSITKPHGALAQKRMRMENCPVCDLSVLRSKLEEHVHKCLSDADLRSFVAEDDEVSTPYGLAGASSKPAAGGSNRFVGTKPSSQPRCPLCDLAVPREELESHVQACMVSEGLEGLF